MNILVVGGGPAGLCFALLTKQRHPAHEITVLERGRPNQTYGWGITLPRRTAAQLESADGEVAREILQQSVTWDHVHVFHRGRRVEIAGTKLLGISRLALLEIFQKRCEELGVRLLFETALDSTRLSDYDLVVAADGAASTARTSFAHLFGASTRQGLNSYVWLGTPRVFAGLTFSLATCADGLFIGHGYPFSADMSTFIVECRNETRQAARVADRSDEETCAYLADVFAETLNGQPLLFRRSVRWASFTHVKNERWHHGRMVLIGDAAHAVHFSVGSGTMLA